MTSIYDSQELSINKIHVDYVVDSAYVAETKYFWKIYFANLPRGNSF